MTMTMTMTGRKSMIICDNYNIDDYYDDKDVNDDENYGTLFLQFQEY